MKIYAVGTEFSVWTDCNLDEAMLAFRNFAKVPKMARHSPLGFFPNQCDIPRPRYIICVK
jgi:hypothetical protein